MRPRRLVAVAAIAPLVVSALTGSALAGPGGAHPAPTPHFHPGAPGGGDPYFPYQGNGGYDVKHYDLTVRYHPASRELVGIERLTAAARTDLSRLNLDLRRALTVTTVSVAGHPATFAQRRSHELVITPHVPLHQGRTFDVDVTYHGTAHAVHDPDGSLDGFIRTDDGAFVASEPQGAPSWYAVNDTPDDKASYAVRITVPRGLTAVSNGRLVFVKRRPHHRVMWAWRIGKPISSYLVTATIGKFAIERGTTPKGVPYFEAVDPREKTAWRVLKTLPAIIDYFSKVYGTYPFGYAGAIVDHAHRVGYALETATRPLFDRAPDEATLSHELAHQWYGDTVTLHHWRDIWLNEGFAEFSSWLWTEHTGGQSAAKRLRELLRQPASSGIWSPPPGNPGDAKHIFSGSVYERGAGTLEALREKVGDKTFFHIMRGWLRAHRYGNARVPQFTRYAASVAGMNLRPFFHKWLYHQGKPGS